MNLKTLTKIQGFVGMEFGTFKLREGMSEVDMLKAAQVADENFLSNEEGFLGHVVLKGKDGLYADVAFATTQEKAEEVCGKWVENEYTMKYIEVIDPESVNMSFWERIK
jgi:hypothetical protein